MYDAAISSPAATIAAFDAVRSETERRAVALSDEDQCIQSMPDASPAKWHRAHTTWFFEEFVVAPYVEGYRPFDSAFRFLFNSYYEAVGARHPRPSRGLLTRPSCAHVTAYRCHVDAAMRALLAAGAPVIGLTELGLNHEQQHQELLLTDMLHAFAQNPLRPAVCPGWVEPSVDPATGDMLDMDGGIVAIGCDTHQFAFDAETPRHDVLVQPFRISDRLVRNGEFLAFMSNGGYRRPELWMSDGWSCVQDGGWQSPLYWQQRDGVWYQMGLGGLTLLEAEASVRNISWYEADAYARWAGARLPTEQEWEVAAADPRFRERDTYAWQWTASAFLPYPRYRPAPGAVGEYNGKFMINQMVLRGGSLATPAGHTRTTYRNFFPPDKRWQFSGVRLASDR